VPERFDLCVIGGGSGGLSVAAGAAQMGARVVLIEAGEMGGDCLNYGCVPSKALLAAAHAAHAHRRSTTFGVTGREPDIDFPAVKRHVREVIEAIAPVDSQERFEGLGVTVVRDRARFVDRRTVEAAGRRFRARRFVVATGSRPVRPPIPGIEEVPVLTNETVFDLQTRPERLVVVGGGPIGCEMAQAHRRLGCKVTLVERASILPKDDPEMVAVVRERLVREGVELLEHSAIERIRPREAGRAVLSVSREGVAFDVEADAVLVAAGREPVVDGLGLEAAGVDYGPRGVRVDARRRTSNPRVFAIGDCREGPQFTHAAGYEAGIVIQNALLRIPAKADFSALPWVTYTDPELAHVGLTEAAARECYGDRLRVLTWSFHENDRAQSERRTEGRIKVMAVKGAPVGATIVGLRAGELIAVWALAISSGVSLRAVASTVVPYPTLAEVNKRAAGSAFTKALFGPGVRAAVKTLSLLQ
jgi:pyruvate/2-oxoglutarate dehydrogenase complex dihydrolipoamide dehydrogenase (E3) component